MAGPIFRIRAAFAPLVESSLIYYFYAGLLDLEEQGEIEISWITRRSWEDYAIYLEIERVADRAVRKVCFDIHDRSYLFSQALLARCDVYFKRNYLAADVGKLPDEARRKVRGGGPVFGPGSRYGWGGLVAAWLRYSARRPRRTWKSFRNLTNFMRLPRTPDFERAPEGDLPRKVLFQTRLWSESEVTAPPFAPEVNEDRVQVIRALREGLGDRFVGGALPTPFANQNYPDVVCAWDTRRSAYLQTMKGCLVGVYTMGLHYAMAWKLGEYLASSMCIVASGMRNEFVEPLSDPHNYLGFTTPEECLIKCEQLLNDRDESAAMIQANHAYYRDHVRPTTQVMRWLKESFTEAGA